MAQGIKINVAAVTDNVLDVLVDFSKSDPNEIFVKEVLTNSATETFATLDLLSDAGVCTKAAFHVKQIPSLEVMLYL